MEWEYKTVELGEFLNERKELSVVEHLNEYGKKHWELISIFEPKAQSYGIPNKLDESFLIFKRPVNAK